MRTFRCLLLSFLAGATALAYAPLAVKAQEDPKDIVAVQVRSQGHECKSPQSAEMDQAASIPDEPVWILKCENATYRVRMKPDMAAVIEVMD
jgi:hypothetical protein